MLIRSKSGKLYDIKKTNYISEIDYNKAIMAIKVETSKLVDKPDSAKQDIMDIIKRATNK